MDMPAVGEIVLYAPAKIGAWGSDPVPFLVVRTDGVLIDGYAFPPRMGPAWKDRISAGDTPGTWHWPTKTRTS